jgi:hypothetical protein
MTPPDDFTESGLSFQRFSTIDPVKKAAKRYAKMNPARSSELRSISSNPREFALILWGTPKAKETTSFSAHKPPADLELTGFWV